MPQHEHPKKYHLIVDHKPHDWPEPVITGAEIRGLAGVDAGYQVWQELPGKKDIEIGPNQSVRLDGHGTERFFTVQTQTKDG